MGVRFKEALSRKRVIIGVALLFRFGYITGTKKGKILTPVARCGGPMSGFTRTAAISEAVSGGLCSTFLTHVSARPPRAHSFWSSIPSS